MINDKHPLEKVQQKLVIIHALFAGTRKRKASLKKLMWQQVASR